MKSKEQQMNSLIQERDLLENELKSWREREQTQRPSTNGMDVLQSKVKDLEAELSQMKLKDSQRKGSLMKRST